MPLVFSAALALASCAPAAVRPAAYEGLGIEDVMRMNGPIEGIRASASVKAKKADMAVSGEAFISVTERTLEMRVYSMGLLSMELYEEEGAITSNPPVDGSREAAIVDGLRGGLLWWSVKGYRVEETEADYIVRNSWKRLVVDKKTLAPLRQTIELQDGLTVKVSYGRPVFVEGVFYPSFVKMEVGAYSVDLNIGEISFRRGNRGSEGR